MEEIIDNADINWKFFVDNDDGYFDIDVFAHYLDHGYPEIRETVSGIPVLLTHLPHLLPLTHAPLTQSLHRNPLYRIHIASPYIDPHTVLTDASLASGY
jgi:hypothetical protein